MVVRGPVVPVLLWSSQITDSTGMQVKPEGIWTKLMRAGGPGDRITEPRFALFLFSVFLPFLAPWALQRNDSTSARIAENPNRRWPGSRSNYEIERSRFHFQIPFVNAPVNLSRSLLAAPGIRHIATGRSPVAVPSSARTALEA
ncbi:hypothetical protein B0H17DRAFT_431369 [Mycena rosella]|uniref:Uncharacterized protein n=1 Tax=Mycena rosella TaxID=1033263 RepID=A0AAD7DPB6_MYCRO|nr:hypothetical protein B0H17DRAFT_431369 [Mycena rosella]